MLEEEQAQMSDEPSKPAEDANEINALRRELAEAKRERDLVIENSSDGFWDWRLKDDYEYLSPRFWDILGFAPEEKEHHPSAWQSLIHPDDLPGVSACLDAHMASKGVVPFDQRVRYQHKAGHWVTVRYRGRVIEWDDDGSAIRMLGTHTDITTLVEAGTRAEILYSASTVGIWDWLDLEQEREFWNPHFYELLGYREGEIEPTLSNFQKLLHPDDQAKTFAMVNSHLAGESDFDLEYRLLHKSGEYRWFRGKAKAVFDDAGKATRMVGSIQDIHELHVAQEQVDVLALRHKLSLSASQIGIWDWDVTTNIVVWDEQMYRIYGVSPENFGSAFEAWLAGVHPDDREEGQRRIDRALSGEEEFDTKFRVICEDGSVRWIRAIAATIRDAEGTPIRMVGVNEDVTESETYEATLKAAANELRASNEELERFVYFASHDLQAPIRHIAAFTQLLSEKLDSSLDDETKQWFDFVALGAERMQLLVQDLLTYATAGRETKAPKEVPLADVVEEATSMLRNEDGSAQIQVEAKELPTVIGHRSQIHQVLQNLLENAAKYARPDAPARARVFVDESPSHWFLRVQDNGQGIPSQYLDRIFEPFQKLSADDPKSSGIGLAICTKVAQRHGGEMSIESEPGVGSTFSMSIEKPRIAGR